MKTLVKIKLLLLCLYLFPDLQAQVTIGIMEMPAEGALLQLKNIAGAGNGEKNADKGLLMPRVSLSDYKSLSPALTTNLTAEEMKKHAGLIVYNLTESTEKKLTKGLMVWSGVEWNSIENNVMTEDTGMEIQKLVYNDTKPRENSSVLFQSIEVRMKEGSSQAYYGYPQFKLTDLSTLPRIYKYHFTQYWATSTTTDIGYSNDVKQIEWSASDNIDYKNFVDNDISLSERDETWIYDETSNEIYHIQFIVIGKNDANATKTYAILAEKF
jgi:hypothetical protein